MDVLFFIGSVFPYGVAWSSRGRNLAKLLKSLGNNIHIIANYTYEIGYTPSEVQEFNGYTYQALRTKIGRFDRVINPSLDLIEIKKYIENNHVDIFISSSYPDIFLKLREYLNKKDIPLYLEQCEWFDPSTFRLGKYDPSYRSLMKHIDKYFEKSDGIIAISSLFEEYYSAKGVKVIRIPTILDTSEIESSELCSDDGILRLVFAGNIGGRKELLYPILKGIEMLDDESYKVEFNIYGPDKKSVLINIDNDEELLCKLENTVFIYGMVPQQEVDYHLRQADFMIFIRPDRRSSNAGFPTKFAESMSVGTPVITNLTSDIGMYLNDGINGFLLEDNSPEAVYKTLKKALKLSVPEKRELRYNARKTAEKSFDYRCYKTVMRDFLL